MRDLRRRKWSIALWIAAAVWCGVLFFLSGQPGEVSEQESLDIVKMLLRGAQALRGQGGEIEPSVVMQILQVVVRKLAHVATFVVQGMLLGGAALSSMEPPKRACKLALPLVLAIGTLNELHQAIVPGRECKFTDVLLNCGGGIVGVLLALWLLRFLLRRARRRPML